MNPPVITGTLAAGQCPLCHQPNNCQRCTASADKDPCWCGEVDIPAALLAQVPENFRDRACICRNCVEKFQREGRLSASAV